MKILIWSPWYPGYHCGHDLHHYLFRTHYKHHGKYPDQIEFYKLLPNWYPGGSEAVSNLPIDLDAVFVGIYTWNKQLCYDFTTELNIRYPDVPVYFAGPEVNFHDQTEILSFPNVVGAIDGEGEGPLTDILDNLYEGKDLFSVPGLWVKKENQFVKPKLPATRICYKGGRGSNSANMIEIDYSPLLENIDEILSDIEFHNNCGLQPTKMLTYWLQLSRGCPYGCVYCDWGGGIAQKVRRRPEALYNKEIELVVRHWNSVYITDANFGIFSEDLDVAKKFVETIKEEKKEFYIGYNIAKNNLTTVNDIIAVTKEYYPPGSVIVPIQSADEHTLKVIKRKQLPGPTLYELYTDTLNETCQTQLIIGLPGTSYEAELKGIFEAYDNNVNSKPTLCLVMPQAPMASPEFIKEWNIETFYTPYYYSPFNEDNDEGSGFEIRYIKSCTGFNEDKLIKVLLIIELLKLLEECWITKFAKQLANLSGYTAKDFYQPIIDKFFNDQGWLLTDQFYESYQNWFNGKTAYGAVNSTFICELLIENFINNKDQLKEDLLTLIGHMHPYMEQALDVGFGILPSADKVAKYNVNFDIVNGKIKIVDNKKDIWIVRDPVNAGNNSEQLRLLWSLSGLNKKIFTSQEDIKKYLLSLRKNSF